MSNLVTSAPFPGVFTTRECDQALRQIPTRDLLAEIEAARWHALEVAGNAAHRAFAEHELDRMVKELERRQRLLARQAGDPLAPAWSARDRDLQGRVEAVKAAWPIERFCAELLMVSLKPHGRDSLWCACPLPGHRDRTPSFHVTPSKGVAYCQGCKRGGDVIRLTQYVMGLDRFYDALERLEAETGTSARQSA